MLRRSLKWSFGGSWVQQGLSALTTLVLAAIVGPAEFGVIAMASVVVGFAAMLADQGFGPALVQREDLRPGHLHAAFAMSSGLAVALTLAVALLGAGLERVAVAPGAAGGGWPGAVVGRTPELGRVVLWLSPLVLLRSLLIIPDSLLRRELAFRALAVRSIVASALGAALGVTLALKGYGVMALVAQQIVEAVASLVVLWATRVYRPALRFSRGEARDVMSFSSMVLLGGIATFVSKRSDALIIGAFFGPLPVGLFRLAVRLKELVSMVTFRPIQQMGLPYVTRRARDGEALGPSGLRLLHVSLMACLPFLGTLAGSAGAVLAVLGPAWVPATDALAVLAGAGAVEATVLFGSLMATAAGRPSVRAIAGWAGAAVSVAALLAASVLLAGRPDGTVTVGLALARLASVAVVGLPVLLFSFSRLAGVPIAQVLRAAALPGLAGAAGAAGSFGATTLVASAGLGAWPALVIVGLCGVASAAPVLALDPLFRAECVRLLDSKLGTAVRSGRAQAPPTEGTSRGRQLPRGGRPLGRAPDFLIAGEMKCGTTSIWELLRHHPGLFFPDEKELFVLDRPDLSEGEVSAYLALFADAGPHRLAGEATPTYLFRRAAPRHARAIAPHARVIAIVRDPVDRAWSHYWHNVRRGRERVPFEEAIRRDAGIADSEHAYLERGHYADSLARWAQVVGRERIRVTTMDRLRADPAGVASELCAFLGVAPPPETELPHANKASYPRWPGLDRVLKGPAKAATALPVVGPVVRSLGNATRRWRTYSGAPRMKPATREALRKEYEASDARLAEWLGGPAPWRVERGGAG